MIRFFWGVSVLIALGIACLLIWLSIFLFHQLLNINLWVGLILGWLLIWGVWEGYFFIVIRLMVMVFGEAAIRKWRVTSIARMSSLSKVVDRALR